MGERATNKAGEILRDVKNDHGVEFQILLRPVPFISCKGGREMIVLGFQNYRSF